ncbi:MAG TPA: molecular chaperone DnaJ [Armatimonadota bacterium]|nr:molecular chaperone DnaJ [Armatimonadota bacterium]
MRVILIAIALLVCGNYIIPANWFTLMVTEVRRLSPEEQELAKKLQELDALETELAQNELDYATLQAEIRAFERRYVSTVGIRYAELNEIKLHIAELQVDLTPNDATIYEEMEQARINMAQTTEAVGGIQEQTAQQDDDNAASEPEIFKPSDQLKKLYREIAKNLHPDLTTDPNERTRRQSIMSQANEAYQHGDEARLEAILLEWEHSPDAVQGEGPAMELIRVIRKIAQIQERHEILTQEADKLQQSELFELKKMVDVAEKHGKDVLASIAEQLDATIAQERKRLETLHREESHAQ